VLLGKEEKPQMFGKEIIVCETDKNKFKSPFGEPPVVEKRKLFEPSSARKRKPVSFFDPTRDRTIHNEEEEGDEQSP
jgi:hypothetical protein